MDLYPLIFKAKAVPKVWGSESWKLYDLPEDSAVVSQGWLAGQTLQQVMKEWGPRLLGPLEFEKGHERFPLMIKTIDAREALSLQVHPDDDLALRLAGPLASGKSEASLILEASPGADFVAGFKPGTTRSDFVAAQKKDLEPILRRFPVKAGDCIFIPAGRIHAIGKGCLVTEVAQNSDTTFRIHDYGRLEEGKSRPLHLSQALECLRFGPEMDAVPDLQPDGAVDCEQFKGERLRVSGPLALNPAQPVFQLLMGLKGKAVLRSASGLIDLAAGDAALIPASVTVSVEGASAEIYRVRP